MRLVRVVLVWMMFMVSGAVMAAEPAVVLAGPAPADGAQGPAGDECDAQTVEFVVKGEKVYAGSVGEFLKQYGHGPAMFGNRPDRSTFRLGAMLKQYGDSSSTRVRLSLCMMDPIDIPVAELRAGKDRWLVGTLTEELRVFLVQDGGRQPQKRQKRVVSIELD